MVKKISPRMRRMVDYYLGEAGMNMAKAMVMAGYAQKTAHHMASATFAHPHAVAYLEQRQKITAKRFEVTYERTIGELAKVAYANMGDYMDIDPETGVILIEGKNLSELDYEQLAALGEVTTDTSYIGKGDDRETVVKTKVKLHNKLTALDMLMRHSGQSKEKQPLDGAASLVDRIIAGRERTREKEREEDDESNNSS